MRSRIEIEHVFAREVLDSRGNPTIEVEVETERGKVGKAIVPSGASTDSSEVIELRDNDKKRHNGKGVLNAVHNVNNIIARELVGMNALEQTTIDHYMNYMDGTKNKSSLGANAILGVSMAVARAAANSLNIPLYLYIGGISGTTLPYPMMNVINGGKHVENNINMQEFMIVPRNVEHFSNRLRMCTEVYHALKSILKEDGIRTGVGDEGGFCPSLRSDLECLDYLMRAIEKANYLDNFAIAIDVAASEMYHNGKYTFWKTGEELTSDELIDIYEDIASKYPVLAIEDGLAEEDWEGWKNLTNALGEKMHLVGDALFTTNTERLMKGIKTKTANSILIKPNQIGTLTETIETIKMAKANGYLPIMSHCSGDSEDSFIADFSVALNMKYLKSGAPARSEHTSKYNRLLQIEEDLINLIED